MNKSILYLFLVLCSTTFYSQDYRFGNVSKNELAEKAHTLEPDANAAVLFRQMHTSFNYNQEDGFVLQTKVHERIKIYNKKGYGYATVKLGMRVGNNNSKEQIIGLKAFSYNLVNDKIVKSKLQAKNTFKEELSRVRNVVKFTMPDVSDGTVIEYKYTFISPFISNVDEYVFQEKIPISKIDMSFISPEYMVYKPYGKGTISLGMTTEDRSRSVKYITKSSTGGRYSHVKAGNGTFEFVEKGFFVKLSNMPSIKKESFSTNEKNYSSSLKFELTHTQFPDTPVKNYAATWEDVANEIYRSEQFGAELKKEKYYKKDIDALLEGVSTSKEKMNIIFEFVKEKMNWNEYYGVYADKGVKKAYESGVGNVADINLILNSILNYAGVEAYPVLISTKSNGISFFPTRRGFNYVISGVKIEGELYLLDAVDKEGVVNILKPELLNWKGRMIKADGTSRLIELYPSKPALHNSIVDITINNNGEIKGASKNRYSSHYAKSKRDTYRNLNSNGQLETLNSKYGSIDVIDHSLKNLKEVSKPLFLEFNFEADGAAELIGDKLYITPLIHLATETNYFKAEERKSPIDFIYSWTDRYIINITIPEGYEIDSKPKDLAIKLPENMGSYRFNMTKMGDKLSFSVQNTMSIPVIPPSRYKDLQAYFNLIVEKEAEKLVLKKI